MSEIPPTNLERIFFVARKTLKETCDNPIYLDYIAEEGPLTIDNLPDDLLGSEEFKELVDTLGWPEDADRVILSLSEHDSEFKNITLPEFVDRFVSLDGSKSAAQGLTNFDKWLTTDPTLDDFMSTGTLNPYGTHPAVHRMNILMPDTMDAIKLLLADMESRNGGVRTRASRDEFLQEDNQDLVRAIKMMYQIAARLLKVDDRQRQRQILIPGSPATGKDIVTDAFKELRT